MSKAILTLAAITAIAILPTTSTGAGKAKTKGPEQAWQTLDYAYSSLPGATYPSNTAIQIELPKSAAPMVKYPPEHPLLLAVMQKFPSPTTLGSQLTATITMTVTGSLTFGAYIEPGYTCVSNTKPGLWLYMTSENLTDKHPPLNPNDRWWSNAHIDLDAIGAGANLTAFLDPAEWKNANGEPGTMRPTDFAAVVKGAKMVGLFGGGPCVRHGVYTIGSGMATLTVLGWGQ